MLFGTLKSEPGKISVLPQLNSVLMASTKYSDLQMGSMSKVCLQVSSLKYVHKNLVITSG